MAVAACLVPEASTIEAGRRRAGVRTERPAAAAAAVDAREPGKRSKWPGERPAKGATERTAKGRKGHAAPCATGYGRLCVTPASSAATAASTVAERVAIDGYVAVVDCASLLIH